MSRTIMELFHSSGLKESVKADKETFVEQETSGIRIKSLVDVNNPLIYNNISQSTDFRVKVREANGCNASSWSQVITVPIVTFNTLPIWHN